MKGQIVSKRYAEAFFSFCGDSIGRDAAVEELKKLKVVLRQNPDFDAFLHNPEITLAEKVEVIGKALGGAFSQEMLIFLRYLLEKERFAQIETICDYARVTYSHGQTVEAVLTTSYPVEIEMLQGLKDKLEQVLNCKLNVYLNLDADILGGVQVRIGNRIIDGSVRRRLVELREKLMTTRV